MDRNSRGMNIILFITVSLSARRAWIEIAVTVFVLLVNGESLSARRAWIEIQNDGPSFSVREVALRKESVDRNTNFHPAGLFDLRRSPQGERG